MTEKQEKNGEERIIGVDMDFLCCGTKEKVKEDGWTRRFQKLTYLPFNMAFILFLRPFFFKEKVRRI